MSSRCPVWSLITIFVSACSAVPQDVPPPQKHQIGLVLEGGAALGLAHIGVLQWLEEHRIPISYVAGTSMGGLVGGIYATGNSPAEIRQLVDSIDWNDVLRGQIPYQDLSLRRKEDAEEYPNGLEFGIKDGIRFPEGFNSGHQVGLILDRIALPYSEVKNFDELPIPFACVGTDLVSKKKRVFQDGSLAQALRATMSLPGIFTPVRTGDSVYVDGGLLDNLPVDVAQQMGADLIIAVHLQSKPLEPAEPLSSVSVLSRSISVMIAANELQSMQKADILISVPLAEYSGADYKKNEAIIRAGYEAAASKAAILSAFSVDEASWQSYLARRNARRKGVPTPQFIEVVGTKPMLAKEIEHKLAGNVGKPIDTTTLERQLTYLSGVGRYSRLGYREIQRDDSEGLLIVADEKEYGHPIVRPLVVIDGSEYDQVQFLLGARITFLDVGGFGSEWRNDLILGSEHAARSEFYRPFGETLRWFVAPQAFASNTQLNLYSGNTFISQYRNRQAGGAFDVGYTPNRSSEIRLGYEIAEQKFSPVIGTTPLATVQGRIGTTSLSYQFDGRDDPIIPTRGLDLSLKSEWYDANPGANAGFPLAEAHLTKFQPLNNASSIFLSAAGGTTFSYHKTGVPPFWLGGSADLVAYGTNEFLTNQYFLFRAGYIRKLWELPPLIGRQIYAVGTYEAGKVYDLPANVSSLPTDFSAALVVNTIFGPVTVGGAYGATDHHKFFYRLGRVF